MVSYSNFTKRFLFFSAIVVTIPSSFSQGNWIQKADFAGTTRWGSVGFSIGNKGYIGTGNDGNYTNDFWEWNQETNTWTQKADFGGNPRNRAVGFSIGTKGYIGTGWNGITRYNDFWEWDQATNTWIPKTNFGGTARYGAVGLVIGTKGYIGTGYGTNGVTNDFWEWDQITDTWTQKANFGGTTRYVAIAFAIGTKGYIGTGYSAGNTNDFWEWDQATDTWSQKTNFGGAAREGAIGFSIGNKGYIGTGNSIGGYKQDFWEWDQATDTWSQKANFDGTPRPGCIGFSIGNKGYIGTGIDPVRQQDFWEFNPITTPQICLVTVDSISQYNIIVWDKTPYLNSSVDSFIIHREVMTNVYLPIGSVSVDSMSHFADTARTKYFVAPYWSLGDPNAGTYRYKLQVRDTCGNYSPLSPYHNTIFMSNNNGTFSWPQLYTIEDSANPVNNYLLLRDNFNTGNWQVVNSVAGTQQSITDPQYSTWQATANWRIETQWDISCTATKSSVSYNSSRSNVKLIAPPGSINEMDLENLISIYPNPNNGSFTLILPALGFRFPATIKIYNVLGEEIYSDKILNPISNLSRTEGREILNLNVPSGIYYLQIICETGMFNKKIRVE